MKCPVDGETDLVMTERAGVEIDYCPKCRGVWLDRGELDKILERSRGETTAPPAQPAAAAPPPQFPNQIPGYQHSPYSTRRHDDDALRHDRRYEDDYYKRKKRKSLLDDIFDF
jgi:Zn-finger nucleic acid-binding protein